MTDLVELLVIARIDTTAAVADLFSCQTYDDADTGTETGPGVEAMWETLTVDPAAPICLDSLDQALTTSGYRRTSAWRKRVTAAGAIRYFAHATIESPTCPKPAGASQPPPEREPGGLTRAYDLIFPRSFLAALDCARGANPDFAVLLSGISPPSTGSARRRHRSSSSHRRFQPTETHCRAVCLANDRS
ncbi:hypothetical protein [Nocardia farcinica]|uniref:hypothetical protein n=1 Tax=Nocardia farcinica TaxID=37329 RepID=UPI0037933A7C